MRKTTKHWMLAFTVSILVCVCGILGLLLYLQAQTPQVTAEETPAPVRRETDAVSFEDVQDNVGAVTFTEDQITEIARNVFSLDGFLQHVGVRLQDDGKIILSANIKDKEALIEEYPELAPYELLLGALEQKKITVNGALEEERGLATFRVSDVTVAGVPIDRNLIRPLLEEADFAELFRVDYDSVEVRDGMLVFSDGVPAILQY